MLRGPESLSVAWGFERLKQRGGLIRFALCKDHFESSVENDLEGSRSWVSVNIRDGRR